MLKIRLYIKTAYNNSSFPPGLRKAGGFFPQQERNQKMILESQTIQSLDDFLILMAGQQTEPVLNPDSKNLRVDYLDKNGKIRGYTTHIPTIKCYTLFPQRHSFLTETLEK